ILRARNDPKAIVGTSTEEEMMLYTMRFSLVDRPGALGSVATSLSHVPASIVTLRVVEHDGEYAVDEVVLEAEGASPEQIRAAAHGSRSHGGCHVSSSVPSRSAPRRAASSPAAGRVCASAPPNCVRWRSSPGSRYADSQFQSPSPNGAARAGAPTRARASQPS